MQTAPRFACGAVLALAISSARTAAASPVPAVPEMFQFGVAPTHTSSQFVDQAHFVYIPAIGPWLEIGRTGATAALVFDGVCQDAAGLAFFAGVVTAIRRSQPQLTAWRITPWFPQSGGGGLSLRADF